MNDRMTTGRRERGVFAALLLLALAAIALVVLVSVRPSDAMQTGAVTSAASSLAATHAKAR